MNMRPLPVGLLMLFFGSLLACSQKKPSNSIVHIDGREMVWYNVDNFSKIVDMETMISRPKNTILSLLYIVKLEYIDVMQTMLP